MPVEGRDLSSRQTQDVGKDRRLGNLSTPISVQKLQKALHAKAKAEPDFRFYALYDKIYREDILAHAYAQCRSNKGVPGVDGQDFADVEAYGRERWLGELALALREETYRPEPIRRVFIPKANGKRRPLGIPTLRDRVCMTAAVRVLEPIFEADLPPEQYAYRPSKRSIQHMVSKIHALTTEAMVWQEATALVSLLNRMLRGWANYFQVGSVSRVYRAIDNYVDKHRFLPVFRAHGKAQEYLCLGSNDRLPTDSGPGYLLLKKKTPNSRGRPNPFVKNYPF